MKSAHSTSLARDLDALYRVGVVVGLDDRELLGRFTSGPGAAAERAFESIVHRHGPMVLAVCRRAVRDEQAAEDAFQATFLVLAMKAGSIRRQESLGPWLHGVAARIARRARARAARRAWKALDPPCLATVTTESGEAEVEAEELRAVLDEEVERLPASYRRPVVLCYLEGKTQEAAALELGWTKGTVSGRLARAKDLLRARLARKGLAPSAGLTGVFPAGEEARAALPANLARDAVRAGLNAALGRSEMIAASGSVATLAGGFLRTMMLGKLSAIAAVLVGLITVATTLARTAAGPAHPGPALPEGKQAASRPQSETPLRTPPPPRRLLPEHARARLGTTRLRHAGFMANVAYAPDGRTLATIGWDGAIRFWDPKTGETAGRLASIEGVGRSPSVAYSPDGTRLAVGHDDFLELRDLATGLEIFRTPVLKGGVREIAFSPDGRTLAAATEEFEPAVRIYEADTGRLRRALRFGERLAYRGRPMSFSPDGQRLAVGFAAADVPRKSLEQIIVIWEVDSDSRPTVIRKAHGHSLTSVTFAPDGKSVLSGGCDSSPSGDRRKPGEKLELSSKIRVWDASSGRPIREFDMSGLAGHCAFTATRDGRTLISLHTDRLIVWDLPAARMVRTIPIEPYYPGVGIGGCMAVSPDGRILAAARGDNAVHLWDLETGKPLLVQAGAHVDEVAAAAISPDGRFAATGGDHGMVLLWDAARGEYFRRLDSGGQGFVRSVRFAPDGRTVAAATMSYDPEAGGFRGIVRLCEIPGGAVRREIPLDDDPIRLAYSPDGRQLAIALVDASNADAGRHPIGSVDVIQVFEVATGARVIGIPDPRFRVDAMTFSADGRTLASVESDAMFRFRDLAPGRTIEVMPNEGHRPAAGSVQPGGRAALCSADLTPDLATAVTAARSDDRLLVWDPRTGRVQRTFQVGAYYDAKVALSADGRLLAAAVSPILVRRGIETRAPGRDTTIRIWEVATKREILHFEPHSSAVRSLAFSPDGKTLVTGMADTTVFIWDCSATHAPPSRPPD